MHSRRDGVGRTLYFFVTAFSCPRAGGARVLTRKRGGHARRRRPYLCLLPVFRYSRFSWGEQRMARSRVWHGSCPVGVHGCSGGAVGVHGYHSIGVPSPVDTPSPVDVPYHLDATSVGTVAIRRAAGAVAARCGTQSVPLTWTACNQPQ